MATIKRGIFGLPRLKKSVRSFMLFVIAVVVSIVILIFGKELETKEIIGYSIVVFSCYAALFMFVYRFRGSVFLITYKVFFLLSSILIFLLLTRVVEEGENKELLYIVPYTIIAVVIRTFFDARTAMYVLLVELLLAGLMIPQPFVFILINYIAGMVAIFTLDGINVRSRIIVASLVVVATYMVIYTGTSFIYNPEFQLFSNSSLFIFNGALTLLCYPLILIFEKYFLIISDATLLNLSDKSQPLLRKLADEAPGSFHHSLQVANLAEEAAREIGANTMLVRTGALYHDIGKIASSNYYTENQVDNINPHDNLDPKQSAAIIIGHVKKGIILGRNYKLPSEVIDFIATHHGTSTAYYFFKKYSDKYPGMKPAEKDFNYPGPKPFSKETALVMMADAIEAASRSLGDYSEESIENFIDKILYLQEQDGQFSKVPLTYKDMSDIKAVFKRMLSNMYHARVIYPERNS